MDGRTSLLLGSAVLAGCGVHIPARARIEAARPFLATVGKPSIASERLGSIDGYLVTIPAPPARAGTRESTILGTLRATLRSGTGRRGLLEIYRRGTVGNERFEITIPELPDSFDSPTLEVESLGVRAVYRLSGLRTRADHSGAPRELNTPYGPIRAIGVYDTGDGKSAGAVFGGIALELPRPAGHRPRLRRMELRPLYAAYGGGHSQYQVDRTRTPAQMTNEGFGHERWECRGFYELMTVGEARPIDALSPVRLQKIAEDTWSLSVDSAPNVTEEFEVQFDGRDWQSASSVPTLTVRPKASRYRRLEVATSIPFTLQAGRERSLRIGRGNERDRTWTMVDADDPKNQRAKPASTTPRA